MAWTLSRAPRPWSLGNNVHLKPQLMLPQGNKLSKVVPWLQSRAWHFRKGESGEQSWGGDPSAKVKGKQRLPWKSSELTEPSSLTNKA